MENKNVNYEGIFIPGIGILILAHFAGMCVNGLCAPDWLTKNLVASIFTVIVFLWFLLKSAKSSALFLYRQTKNLQCVLNHYKKVRLYGYFGLIYSLGIWMFPSTSLDYMIKGTVLSSFIILISSVIIIIVVSSDINRIKNRRWTIYNKSGCFSSRFFVFFGWIFVKD